MPKRGATGADITKMSDAEIAAFMHQRAVARSKELRERAPKMRKALEQYASETFNFSLDEILGTLGTSKATNSNGDGRKTYRNPDTGETWSYPSRGRMPKWIRGRGGNPKSEYLVN